MPPIRKEIHYGEAASGVAPDALTDPWEVETTGSPTTTVTDAGWILSANSSDSHDYIKAFYTAATVRFEPGDLEFQLEVSVSSITSTGLAFIFITDGSRLCTVSIGTSLKWYSLGTSTAIRTILDNFGYADTHVYHLLKRGTERWDLRVDGRLVGSLPYTMADDGGGVPSACFGVTSGGALVTATFDRVEIAANLKLPPSWKVDRFFAELHPSIQKEFTEEGRALIRAIVGEMEEGQDKITQALPGLQAGRSDTRDIYRFAGDVEPHSVVPAWTESDPPYVSVSRGKVYSNGGSGDGRITAVLTVDVAVPGMVTYGRTWFKVDTYSAGTDDLVCHAVTVLTGDCAVSASLYETGTSAWGWTLVDGDHTVSGSVTGRYWPANPYRDTEVELVVIGDEDVLLLVDGMIVDRAQVSDFTSPAVTHSVVLSGGQNSADEGDANVYFWAAEAGVYGYDRSRRVLFDQMCIEDLVFVGGCESNQILDAFDRHRFGMLALRGTTRGILMDVWRLTCQPHTYVTAQTTPAQWYLGYTWPGYTPVFLGAPDSIRDIFVEFSAWPPNFTLTSFCDLLARYIVPMSVLEHEFHLSLIAVVTASISAGSSVNIAVTSSDGFEVDDTVTVRNFANSSREDATVTAIPDSTHITVDVLAGSYSHGATTPPIVRKVIRST